MAAKAFMTLNEVMDELENLDEEISDDSEDDFDGYLDESEIEDIEDIDKEETSSDKDSDMDASAPVDASASVDASAPMDASTPIIPRYTHKTGLSATLTDKSPLAHFSLFITQDMLEKIVEQTKLYSEQYKNSHTLGSKSRIHRWLKVDPTVPELLEFIALVLVMGIIRYPTIESHWNTSWPYACDTFRRVSCYI